ncbi:metallophosphoesterase [Sphingomonas sp. LB-2]|uniref:metallophosphoesterase n=1 Tax=Sphingomonas caeni TaxID=2984949 RepID=UPI00222F5DD8|nr:metallophosphoesterase [Sphingomonas caeni]MCW3847077.1 metallophosphoesterase [Sphingomonas caeni]
MWKLLRYLLRAIGPLVALGVLLLLWGLIEARSDPRVRRAEILLADWPPDAPPVRVVLLSDIHAGTPTVTPARLTRIVAQVNALAPDLILIAGDFTPASDPLEARTVRYALAPLAGLRARLGVVAVPGNHDHWTGIGALNAALAAAGIEVLANRAVVRGPLVIGGVDDDYSRHADLSGTIAQMRRLRGARLILTHSPDIAPDLPTGFELLFAGHTHCGQGVIPGYGGVVSVSKFGERYRCGVIREGARTVVVTAGIGTSGPGLRINAPPDLWLITLRGKAVLVR